MTYLISRANYTRCTEGMTDAERADFDRDFLPYPERVSPDGRIDVDQVADEYALLHARETGMPAKPTLQPARTRGPLAGRDLLVWSCPKGNGKSSWQPPELELFTPDPGPAPTITDLAEEHWPWRHTYMDVETYLSDVAPLEDDRARRYYLNAWVNDRQAEPKTCTVDDVLSAVRAFRERFTDRPGPRRVVCGEIALAAFRLASWPATVHVAAGQVLDLSGIPLVADPDLPADTWRLVDAVTDEVLHEGTISPALTRLIQEMYETADDLVDDLAARTGVPRDLLWPPTSGA